MNFLIDTDTCSAYLRGDGRAFTRFIQHAGGLSISTIVVAELYSWIYRARTKRELQRGLESLLRDIPLLVVDHDVAQKFGEIRAALLDQGRPTPEMDLLIASTALVHDLTLVTHNVQDFAHLPALRIEDWLSA